MYGSKADLLRLLRNMLSGNANLLDQYRECSTGFKNMRLFALGEIMFAHAKYDRVSLCLAQMPGSRQQQKNNNARLENAQSHFAHVIYSMQLVRSGRWRSVGTRWTGDVASSSDWIGVQRYFRYK